jgi:hypothetical protein
VEQMARASRRRAGTSPGFERALRQLRTSAGQVDRRALAATIDALVLRGTLEPHGIGRDARLRVSEAAAPAVAAISEVLSPADVRVLRSAGQRAHAIWSAWSNTAAASAEYRSSTSVSG